MLDNLDAAAVHRWCDGGLEALRAHQREIDELNVYPVPDGDTGTNLVLTLTAARDALTVRGQPAGPEREGAAPSGPMRRMAHGALLGARGNSGVIVSQILRGMADTFAAAVVVRGDELARALRTATDAAYAAVARPVEGTVLSVVAAAAEAAGRIRSDSLVTVARTASRAAAEALARTPQQLPVLARAGVVDAGGRGLCLLLDALVEALDPAASRDAAGSGDAAGRDRPGSGTRKDSSAGSTLPDHRAHDGARDHPDDNAHDGDHTCDGSHEPKSRAHTHGGGSPGGADARLSGGHGGEGARAGGGRAFEVQYLLDASDEAVGRLRATLAAIGDSLVVVGTGEGDPPTWNVHVHVTEVGPAIEAGIEAGRPYRISVNPLEERLPGVDRRGAVVVAAGDGLTALFEAEGAVVVDRNPSTAEMLAAIEATGATAVVLLPNDANTHAVAISAAREAAREPARGVTWGPAEGATEGTADGAIRGPADGATWGPPDGAPWGGAGGPARGGSRQVSVVPTRSPVQALAALAVRDGQRPFADDVIAMAEAAGACRYGEVCTAQRDALTVAGPCRAGDLLGLVDGEVHVIGGDLAEVSRRLLDRMLGGGGELVTLVLGADVPPGFEDELRGHVHRTWPFIELQCYAGGQPRYHLLAGVE